jgi:hypothetical protein
MTSNATCVPLIARLATKLESERKELFRYDPVRKVSQIWTGQEWVDTFEARATASLAEKAIRRDGDGRYVG